MYSVIESLREAITHLELLYQVFDNEENYDDTEKKAFERYKNNFDALNNIISELNLKEQLYSLKSRQMILADLIEYIFLGRGYYTMQKQEDKEKFIRAIFYLVNTLMTFEDMTVSKKVRKTFLAKLKEKVPAVQREEKFKALENFEGKIGLPLKDSDADEILNKYFDKMLPKTAGGLWHELLVYIFMIRIDVGYIIPLLLSQRFFSKERYIIPPDFLVITHNKHLFGVEVGTKKEIQSGAFSLKTMIPSATVDTINSRCSDRCPACKKWIQFCPHVINNYSRLKLEIEKYEVRCLEECSIYEKEDILVGKCPYTKYMRNRARTLDYTHHDYSDGYHYHYRCVLERVDPSMEKKIISAKDTVAIKTHYPYYQGLEEI